jgi:HAD superfamily hydrolase (TIGR01549 family)
VIFDVDGTLVDSNDAHARAWVQAFTEQGITVAYESVRRAIGMGGDKLMPLVAGIEEDSREGQKISKRRMQIFKDVWLPQLRPFPRTREFVQCLQRDGFALAIASSATDTELHALVDVARVSDLIPIRTSSDDAERSKPDPDIVQAAIERTGCAKARIIMIGDTPYDVKAALNAGIRMIAVTCGGWERDTLRGATAAYDGVADLLAQYDASVLAELAPARSSA